MANGQRLPITPWTVRNADSPTGRPRAALVRATGNRPGSATAERPDWDPTVRQIQSVGEHHASEGSSTGSCRSHFAGRQRGARLDLEWGAGGGLGRPSRSYWRTRKAARICASIWGSPSAGQRFEVTKERITNEHAYEGFSNPYIYYENEGGRATLNYRDTSGSDSQRHLRIESVDTEQSILAQRRDPDHYPVLTHLAETLDRIRFYREWEFGRGHRAANAAEDRPAQRLSPRGTGRTWGSY